MNTEVASKIGAYYALNPSEFRVLKSATVSQSLDSTLGEMLQQVHLVLARDDSFAGIMLHLQFDGVRDFKFVQPSWSLITLSNLEISQAQTTSGCGPRLEIRDPEEGVFFFSSRDFWFSVEGAPESDR